jgi:hypothetical protein
MAQRYKKDALDSKKNLVFYPIAVTLYYLCIALVI